MLLIQGTCQCQKTLILYCEVKSMNTKEKKKCKPKEQISKEDYSKKLLTLKVIKSPSTY